MFSRVHLPENVSGRDEKGEKMTDEFYMRRAIELAKKGRGWTNPNPMVGAVIVKDGSIIGEGYHEKCGELHAAFLLCSPESSFRIKHLHF